MDDSAPPGWRYIDFQGGSINGQYRLIKGEPTAGDTYELVGMREVYIFNGECFVFGGEPLPPDVANVLAEPNCP